MISSASAPASKDSATATAATATTPQAAATPFDAILSLESLAATIETLGLADAACMSPDTGLEDPADSPVAEGDDDGDDGDVAGSLEFLASLLALPMTAPVQPVNDATSAGDGEQADGADLPGQPVAGTPLLSATPADPATQPADGAAAGKLVLPDSVTDAASDSDPTSQAPVRGAEWFSHAVRHAAAGERNSIVTHARDPRWAEEFGARISLMVRGGESTASLQLTPVDLGPMEVSINVRDSQASIHFGAAQAETRNLIEASIPRLREMLAAQGFQLMDASVSQGFARQSRSDVPPAQRHEGDAEPETQATTRISATGLLDTYA